MLVFPQGINYKHMRDVTTTMMCLKVGCNTGTTYSKRKGWWQCFHVWLVESGISNLLSVPQHEADGFTIYYNTKRDWFVTTPEGEQIVFKKYTRSVE